MAKEFKSTNELIEILNSKGVSIKDENNVKYLIEKYSYYSIVNSYKWIFKTGENYKDNASFEEIFAMYKFDKNLKIIMLKYILEIEAVIKTKIANLFAEKYGLENYLNINNFTNLIVPYYNFLINKYDTYEKLRNTIILIYQNSVLKSPHKNSIINIYFSILQNHKIYKCVRI